jgi:hypothetical protein
MVYGLDPNAQLVTAAALVVLAVGCRLALESSVAAILAVAPLALLVPWLVPVSAADTGVIFPLSASFVLAGWLLAEMPRNRRAWRFVHWALLASAAAAATVFSPPVLVLFPAVVIYYSVKLGRRAALGLAAALLIIPAACEIGTLALPAYDLGRSLDLSWWLDATIAQGWNVRAWFQSGGGGNYQGVQSDLNELFYLPLLLPFAAAAFACRSRWWFAPTFLWAALLVAGNVVFGGNLYVQRSLTMQMGLIVPFAVAAFDAFHNLEEPASERPAATPSKAPSPRPTCPSASRFSRPSPR